MGSEVRFQNGRKDFRVFGCQCACFLKLHLSLREVVPRVSCQTKIQMRNGMGRKNLGDCQKLALRFFLAIQEPKDGAQIFAGSPKAGIQADRLAIEFLRLSEIL